MKTGIRLLKCIFACALVLGLMPTLTFAEENPSSGDTTNAAPQSVEANPVIETEPQEDATSSDDTLSTETGEEGVQPLNDIQEGPQILEEGDFGEDGSLHWAYRDDASLTLSGTGAMPDYTEDGGQPWSERIGLLERIVVEEGVKSIGAYAFYGSEMVQSLELPDGLERIGSYSFYFCDHLPKLTMPDSVVELGAHCFDRCRRLASVHLSDALRIIPEYAFNNCALVISDDFSINLPNGLEVISDYAFYNVGTIPEVVFPNTLTKIGADSFYNCRILSSVFFPSSIQSAESIGRAFRVDGEVSFGEGISDAVISSILASTKADVIRLPLSVSRISNCGTARNSYELSGSNSNYAVVDGILFSRFGTSKTYSESTAVLEACPTTMSQEFEIPEGTKELKSSSLVNGASESGGNNCFSKITLPASMETVHDDALDIKWLTAIETHADNRYFTSLDGILFSKDMSKLIRCPRGYKFEGVYAIPAPVRSLGRAFCECYFLKGVVIPSGVTTLSGTSFYHCPALTSVQLPVSLTSISGYCFDFMKSNYPQSRNGFTVFFEGSETEWGAVSITGSNESVKNAPKYFDVTAHGIGKEGVLYYADSERVLRVMKDVLLEQPAAVSEIADRDVGDSVAQEISERFDSVVISDSITKVGANAFRGNGQIESIEIPYSITEIGASAFKDCPKLIEVNCLGDAFGVQAADSEGASFDEDIVLHHRPDASGWQDAPAFVEATGRWNGYQIVGDLASNMPVLRDLTLLDSGNRAVHTTKVSGYSQSGIYVEYELVVTSTAGEDITDLVDVEIKSPERTADLSSMVHASTGGTGVYASTDQYKVLYDPITHKVKVGRCVQEGLFEIKAVPKGSLSTGGSVEWELTVTHSEERIYGGMPWPDALALNGHYASDEVKSYSLDVWNQFGESVYGRCDIAVLRGTEDVTDQLENLGLSFSNPPEKKYYVNSMATPGNYKLVFKGSEGSGLQGEIESSLNFTRSPLLINVPYEIQLTGGESFMNLVEVGKEQWANVPYRVRVLDGYDDPCWPEDLEWKIVNEAQEDCGAFFDIDAQGFIKAKAELRDCLTGKQDVTFTLSVQAMGTEYGFSDKIRSSNELHLTVSAPEPSEPVTHTATFKVGDEVIGTVVFEEGDASLVEPALPPKENYLGEWESYDLASKKSDFVVQGTYSPMDPDKVSEIGGRVDTEYGNGLVNINVSATASTKNIKVESSNTKPLDAVMVLDRSGSMNDDGKLDKLKQCAAQFAQKLYENAEKTGADHRIALVGFAYGSVQSGNYNRSGYENSGLLATASGGARTFQEICSQGCSDALLSVNDGGSMNGNILNAINAMTAEGATAADVGFDIARRVFADTPDKTDANGVTRERMVIFITDGVPTSFSATDYNQVTETAAQAISMANVIKQGQGARIYSIGVDANASAEAAFNNASDGAITRGSGWNRTVQSYDFNRFLHAVSSNYPNAMAMSNLGEGNKAAAYYMAASDTSSLDKIFTNILYSTVYSIQAFERATLTYKLPSGFVLTIKNEEDMRASLAQKGLQDEDIEVIRDGDATTLVFHNVKVNREAVDGVNQYVARVSFQVSVDRNVAGEVAAGGSASADIAGQVTTIDVPTVHVPSDRRLIVFKINGEIYEMRDAQVGDAITIPDTDIARWLDLEKQQDPVVKEGDTYVVFETSTLARVYTMKWIVNGISTTESHAFGDELSIPSGIETAVPEGMEISHWSPSLPQTMPAYNTACTAVLTPIHSHSYQASSYITGNCAEGAIVHNVCACGEEQTFPQAPKEHAYKAFLSSAGQYGSTVEKLVCDDCGYTVNKNITYKVSKSSAWGNMTVLDLEKAQNEVIQSGPSDDDISIRFYVGDTMNGRCTIYRIDEQGVQERYTGYVENGYLTFSPDHFSLYVLGDPEGQNNDPASEPTYDQVMEVVKNAELPEMVSDDGGDEDDKPGESTGGDNGSGTDSDTSDKGDSGNNAGGDSGNGDNSGSGDKGEGSSGDNKGGNQGSGDSTSGNASGSNDDANSLVSAEDAQRNGTVVGSDGLAQTGDNTPALIAELSGGAVVAFVLTLVALRLRKRRKAA